MILIQISKLVKSDSGIVYFKGYDYIIDRVDDVLLIIGESRFILFETLIMILSSVPVIFSLFYLVCNTLSLCKIQATQFYTCLVHLFSHELWMK